MKFDQEMDFEVHFATHLTCNKCGKVFERVDLLEAHKLEHKDDSFYCEKCGGEFQSMSQLSHHMKKHHNSDQNALVYDTYTNILEMKDDDPEVNADEAGNEPAQKAIESFLNACINITQYKGPVILEKSALGDEHSITSSM